MSAGTSGNSPSGPEATGPVDSPDATGPDSGSCVGDGSGSTGPAPDATGPDSSGAAGETSGPIISDDRDAAAAAPRPLPSHRH
jgi:hypothetical protein